mmetsp:Transcript_2175/g.2702  ORF Transcript_2175/g.2702 Transcript_2175/m.2702 type:complete len:586 (-) Transcript_2175:121-1878(-)
MAIFEFDEETIKSVKSFLIDIFNDRVFVYAFLLLILVIFIMTAENHHEVIDDVKEQPPIQEKQTRVESAKVKRVHIKLPNDSQVEMKNVKQITDLVVESISVECTFECDQEDIMYNVRVLLNNNHCYLLRKKHRDFAKLYKVLKRTHPEITKLKSLINKTGSFCSKSSSFSENDSNSTQKSSQTITNKKKEWKWANFDLFMEALIKLETPWPMALSKFLDLHEEGHHFLNHHHNHDNNLSESSSIGSQRIPSQKTTSSFVPGNKTSSSSILKSAPTNSSSSSSMILPSPPSSSMHTTAVSTTTTNSLISSSSLSLSQMNNEIDLVILELDKNERKILNEIIKKVDCDTILKHLWPGDSVEKYCLRILKARRFNSHDSILHINEDLEWRNKNDFKQKVITLKPQQILKLSYDMIESYIPIWHQGYDKNNKPFSIQKLGLVRLPILLSNTTLENILNFQAYHTEYMIKLCCNRKNIENFVVILDAENWDAKNIFYSDAFKWVKKMNTINGHHNPDRLARMIIINAPSVVNTFYGMVSYLLDEVTAAKIGIYSTQDQWGPVLKEMIDLHQLPPEYGGTGTNNLKREFE